MKYNGSCECQQWLKLTQTRAAGGTDRGEACSRSAGQTLQVGLRRLAGHCRQLYYRSSAGHHTGILWTGAWRGQVGKDSDCGLNQRRHQGSEYSVLHCEAKELLEMWHYQRQTKKHVLTIYYNRSVTSDLRRGLWDI